MKFCNALQGFLLGLILNFVAIEAQADVKVGVITYNPPFVFSLNQGFDIDLVNMVCQRLKMTCSLIQLPYSQVFNALNEGKIDLLIGGITVPDDGLKNYIATMPYLVSRGQFLVLKSDKLKSINDLNGGKVGVMKGDAYSTASYEYLEHNYHGKLTINTYDNPKTLLAAFTDGVIDAVFINESSAHYWHQMSQGQFNLLGAPITFGHGIAFVALPKQRELIDKINHVLQDIQNDGSYVKLYKAYLMTGYEP